MPLLSHAVVIILSSNAVLTPNGQFFNCATIAFGEWHNTTKRHIWIMHPGPFSDHTTLSTVTTLLIAVHICTCITKC